MGHTRQKLDEAHHFFEKMKESVEENNVYGYNLSVFLTAARSVTLFMQKEYSDKIGFDNWYKDNGTNAVGQRIYVLQLTTQSHDSCKSCFPP